jgi:hypothetical protein
LLAHNSAELKACDQDSQLFVGAVSRVITQIDGAADFLGPKDTVKQILVFVTPQAGRGRQLSPDEIVGQLQGVRRAVKHGIMQQTRAPGSKVANLDIPVDGFYEVWLADAAAVQHNANLLDRAENSVATVAVKTYLFI